MVNAILHNPKLYSPESLDELENYDAIFIDTPPVALVSDAFVIMPMMDGALYSIFFNKVRRKAAQFAAKNGAQRPMPSIFLSGNTTMINVPATEQDPPGREGVIPAVVNLPALLDPEVAP